MCVLVCEVCVCVGVCVCVLVCEVCVCVGVCVGVCVCVCPEVRILLGGTLLTTYRL